MQDRVVTVNRMQQSSGRRACPAAVVSIVHTGLAGRSLLGDAEPTIQVPMELSLSRDACLQDIRQVVTEKPEIVGEMQLAVHELCVTSEQARLLEPL